MFSNRTTFKGTNYSTLLRPMEFSIKFETVHCIVHIERLHVIISKIFIFLSLMINSVLVNSADTDEIPHYAAFHPCLHCLPKYRFSGFLLCWSLLYFTKYVNY